MEQIDWSSLHKILGDNTRRRILELIKEKDAISYTEIMAILGVSNTGRLNYHIKALNGLISKDEEGKYHLTEKGQIAVNLLVSFPQRTREEEKEPMVKISKRAFTAMLILVLGLILIVASFHAYQTQFPTTSTGKFSSRPIPQDTSVYITELVLLNSGSEFSFHWGSPNSIYLYVLNRTQFADLQQQSQGHFLNLTGTPGSYIDKFELKDNSVSLALPQGQYAFYAWSNTSIALDSLSVTQQHYEPVISYLMVAVPAALGALLVALVFLIFTRRVW